MKIIVDENIPYAAQLFGQFGEVISLPGRSITIKQLDDIDILIVRSVTQVNEGLLHGKKIHFVGSTTSGVDHVNKDWLMKAGINFSSAPGCNAISVVEYVFSALLMLAERDSFLLKERSVGIVGVGNIGKKLQKRLQALDVPVLLCDPPLADAVGGDFLSLDELVSRCDILTLHTPLLKQGPYKSVHLVNETLIRKLRPGTILINTSRGSVVDNLALLKCLEEGQHLSVVLDVWENEPDLNIKLVERVDVATPHIAGYTLEGKTRGIIQVFEAYSRLIGEDKKISPDTLMPVPKFEYVALHGSLDQLTLKKLLHLVYDVRCDDALFRNTVEISGKFDKFRKNYIERRECSSLSVMCDDVITKSLLNKLGFSVFHNSES